MEIIVKILRNQALQSGETQHQYDHLQLAVDKKDKFVNILKILLGISGVFIAGGNIANQNSQELQQNDLNNYHIFIASSIVICGLEYFFDFFSTNEIENDVKKVSEETVESKKYFKISHVKARVIQLIPTLIFLSVCITGFLLRSDFDETKIKDYLAAEETLYNQYFNLTGNTTQVSYTNNTEVENSTEINDENQFNKSNQNSHRLLIVDYEFPNITEMNNQILTQGYDSLDQSQQFYFSDTLVNQFKSQYLIFSILAALVFAQNLYSVIFPQSLLYKNNGNWQAIIYFFLFKLARPIASLVIVANINKAQIQLLNFTGPKDYIPFQLSSIVSVEFSLEAQKLCRLLHFVGILLGSIMIILIAVLLLKSNSIKEAENSPTQSQSKVIIFAIFSSLSFLTLCAFQIMAAAHFVKTQPLKQKSPAYLFIINLIIEAFDNACISAILYKIFKDKMHNMRILTCVFAVVLVVPAFMMGFSWLYKNFRKINSSKIQNQRETYIDIEMKDFQIFSQPIKQLPITQELSSSESMISKYHNQSSDQQSNQEVQLQRSDIDSVLNQAQSLIISSIQKSPEHSKLNKSQQNQNLSIIQHDQSDQNLLCQIGQVKNQFIKGTLLFEYQQSLKEPYNQLYKNKTQKIVLNSKLQKAQNMLSLASIDLYSQENSQKLENSFKFMDKALNEMSSIDVMNESLHFSNIKQDLNSEKTESPKNLDFYQLNRKMSPRNNDSIQIIMEQNTKNYFLEFIQSSDDYKE